jgi:CheY-like chemotaxis protein
MTGVLPHSRALRIFLVEDHSDSLDLLRIYLEHSGHIVLFASSKAEALSGIPNANCDVLLSNIGLPDGSGWDLIREVGKSRPAYAIALSGFGMEADCERSAEAGFRHHLVKPVSVAKLTALLDQALAELLERQPSVPFKVYSPPKSPADEIE